jgi:DeoR/GlpR family transcriptional regulator of sugar metabolism
VLLGPLTEYASRPSTRRRSFLSPAGLLDGQLYNQNLLLVQTEMEMIRQSSRSSSGRRRQIRPAGPQRLCGLDEVDVLVTDVEPSPADRADRGADCRLIIAT